MKVSLSFDGNSARLNDCHCPCGSPSTQCRSLGYSTAMWTLSLRRSSSSRAIYTRTESLFPIRDSTISYSTTSPRTDARFRSSTYLEERNCKDSNSCSAALGFRHFEIHSNSYACRRTSLYCELNCFQTKSFLNCVYDESASFIHRNIYLNMIRKAA